MRITEAIQVRADRPEVFAYVKVPSNRSEIIPLLEEVVMLDPEPLQQGSRYIEIATIAGRRFETTYIVVNYQENTQISVATLKSVFPIRVDMRLSDTRDATRIVIDMQLQLKGIYALAAPVIRAIVQQQTRDILRKIKRKVEGQVQS